MEWAPVGHLSDLAFSFGGAHQIYFLLECGFSLFLALVGAYCAQTHAHPNTLVDCFFFQVNFLPLDIRDEEDVALVLHHADYIVQYGEDLEPKQPKDDVRRVGYIHFLWCMYTEWL